MLTAVVLSMIGFDDTSPINCQVGFVSHVWPVILSDPLFTKAWETLGIVSLLFHVHWP